MMMIAMVMMPVGKVRTGRYLQRRVLSSVPPTCLHCKRKKKVEQK